MRISPWIITFVLLTSLVAADNCFTIVNTPTNEKYYWRAVTYDIIKDNSATNWLEKTYNIQTTSGLGTGINYQVRLDKDCFQSYLPSKNTNTGIISQSLYIQKNADDYQTLTPIINSLYTISLSTAPSPSNRLVKDIGTGTIGGINYLTIPSSYQTTGHTEYDQLITGLCDPNKKITEQLEIIRNAIWNNINPGSPDCTGINNAIDCSLKKGLGEPIHYATITALIARKCGIPTRIAYGISEGNFNGIDINLPTNKIHYWTEYYDQYWYTFESSEAGSTMPSTIEINCKNTIDDDQDGKQDCWDQDCYSTIYCQGNLPTTTKFDNQYSTNLELLPNAYDINLLTLGNEHGSITWTNQNINLVNVNIDSGINIAPNEATINLPALNKNCTITLNNINLTEPMILMNNQPCTSCNIKTTIEKSITFTATGTGTYTTQEKNSPINNQTINQTNTSILPPLPETNTGSKITNTLDKAKKLWNDYWSKPLIIKLIPPLLIIILIILYKRHKRNQMYRRFSR